MNRNFLHPFFLIFIFLSTSFSFSQDFTAVDTKVRSYPETRLNSVHELAGMINQDFSSNIEKVRAIYTWITSNVAYSYDARSTMSITYYSEEERIRKMQRYQDVLANITLKSKKAVCHGYSLLFNELCEQLGIESRVIRGFGKSYVSDIGAEYVSNHAWNMVTIEGKDYLIDATWGAGSMNGNHFKREVTYLYFLTPPEFFIKNHYPDNFSDSLLEEHVNKRSFLMNPVVFEKALSQYALINPGIGVLRMKSIEQFEIESKRPIGKIRYYMDGNFHDVESLLIQNNRYSFKIDLNGHYDRELLIYLNDEAAFGFKVRP
ncbi:MAG: hypothetical protein HKP11_04715 [Flavobacteriaceae bacterium]|nr:hypothetical protein [Flavobacteriaceae bacterium]